VLEQLGIDAAAMVAHGPQVWLSITGHGRAEPARNWIGFGDDAAAAGGLVGWRDGTPRFIGDAIADPLTGITAAAAVLHALALGGRWLIDCNLSGVAAHVARTPR
jgi:crotonobetainyl-CoA:carnitine CoA-transferase CaiB-like acyl-CoA transferase